MTIGNHEGHVEDFFLVGIAVIVAVLLLKNTIWPGRSEAA
jgi:hypothetical protein